MRNAYFRDLALGMIVLLSNSGRNGGRRLSEGTTFLPRHLPNEYRLDRGIVFVPCVNKQSNARREIQEPQVRNYGSTCMSCAGVGQVKKLEFTLSFVGQILTKFGCHACVVRNAFV